MEDESARKIQKWWRRIAAQQMVVLKTRIEFEKLCEEIGDKKPNWESDYFCVPSFSENPKEVDILWTQHCIAHRLSILKYQDDLK